MAHIPTATTNTETPVGDSPESLLQVREMESHVLCWLTYHVQGLMGRQPDL